MLLRSIPPANRQRVCAAGIMSRRRTMGVRSDLKVRQEREQMAIVLRGLAANFERLMLTAANSDEATFWERALTRLMSSDATHVR